MSETETAPDLIELLDDYADAAVAVERAHGPRYRSEKQDMDDLRGKILARYFALATDANASLSREAALVGVVKAAREEMAALLVKPKGGNEGADWPTVSEADGDCLARAYVRLTDALTDFANT